MPSFQSLLLVIAFAIAGRTALVSARNIAIAGEANVVVLSNPFSIQQQGPNGTLTSIQLPTGISSFADVSVDPTDQQKVFALSTVNQRVCSFLLSDDNTNLNMVNCEGGNFGVTPFSGVSAHGGTLIVSGGTQGMTAYAYNPETGVIDSQPRFLNQRLDGVVGHPDVLLISSDLAAFSTDFSDLPRFGTLMAVVSGTMPIRERDFRVDNSLNFDLAERPANFPLVNAYNEMTSIMYTANGAVTAQDPMVEGSTVVVPSSIRAVSCAVDASESLLVVGGESNGQYTVQVYSTETPTSPVLMFEKDVEGRLTSVAAQNGVVAYSTVIGDLAVCNKELNQCFAMAPGTSSSPVLNAVYCTMLMMIVTILLQ